MQPADPVGRGRESYARRGWRDAYDALSAADEHTPLDAVDLDRLAMAAYLIGRDEAAVTDLERAHRRFLDQGEVDPPVRCVFWVGMFLLLRGRHAEGGGWLGRAERLLTEHARDTVERGYLLIPTAVHAMGSGDPGRAHELFGEAAGVADRFQRSGWVAARRWSRSPRYAAVWRCSTRRWSR